MKPIKALSIALVLSFMGEQLLWADPQIKPFSFPKSDKLALGFRFQDSVAMVEDSYKNQSTVHSPQTTEKTIYLFQDAHTNESGQRNLSKALDTLLTNEKDIKYVFTEAGVDDNSLTFLRDRAPLNIRKQACDIFLKKGLLHGAELLQLTSEHDFTLWGVEDIGLYQKALSDYRDVVKLRPNLKDYLAKIRATLTTLQPKVLNPFLDRFLADYLKYHRDETALTDYFEGLTRVAEAQDIHLTKYPHLSMLHDLKQKEADIDFAKANTEQVEAMKALNESDRNELSSLMKNEPGRVGANGHTQMAFYALLQEKVTKSQGHNVTGSQGHKVTEYPELEKYFEYLELSKKLEAKQVLDEMARLELNLFSLLAQSEEEKVFIKSTRLLGLFEKLFDLTLTTDEYVEYKDLSRDFSVKELTGFLNRQIMQLGSYYERALFLSKVYDEAVLKSEAFYELTLKRDDIFVEKMLAKMSSESQSQAALVVGGYHAANLKNLFKQKNISYVSVTPQILQETSQKKYEAILLNQKIEIKPGVSPMLPMPNSGRMLMAVALMLTPELAKLENLMPTTATLRPAPADVASPTLSKLSGARLAGQPTVTGAGGFLGKHLVAFLRKERPNISAPESNLLVSPQIGAQAFYGRLPDAKLIQQIVDNSGDEIYHLAAVSKPNDAKKEPKKALLGVLGTARLVNKAGNKRILHTSSELVYSVGIKSPMTRMPEETTPLLNLMGGTPAGIWLRTAYNAFDQYVRDNPDAPLEDDVNFIDSFYTINPIPKQLFDDTYGLVKALDEMFIVKSKNGLSVRLSQIYGAGESRSVARLPKLIRYFLGLDPDMYDLWIQEVRRYIHVKDAVRILVKLAKLKDLPADRIVNVGSPEVFTAENIFEILSTMTSKRPPISYKVNPAPMLPPQSINRLTSMMSSMGLNGFKWTAMEDGLAGILNDHRSLNLSPMEFRDARASLSDEEVRQLIIDLVDDKHGVVPQSAVKSPGHQKDDLPVGHKGDRYPTILVTGGAGFIGSNAVRGLLKTHPSYRFIILDAFKWAGPKEALVDIMGGPYQSRVEVYEGDVTDADLVSVLASKVDGVIHYAAESNVDFSNYDKKVFHTTNVIGTRVLARVFDRENKKRVREGRTRVRFLHVSTDEVTGDSAAGKGKKFQVFTERSQYNATNEYSKTKVEAEEEVRKVNDEPGSELKAVILRMTNVVGPNIGAPKTLGPVALAHIVLGLPIPLFMSHDGVVRFETERDFLNVHDAVRAADVLLHEGRSGEIYNVAGHERRFLIQYVADILTVARNEHVTPETAVSEGLVDILRNNRPHNDMAYVLNDDKFRREFDFESSVQYFEGIRGMVRWALSHKETLIQVIRSEAYERYYRQLYKDYPEKADLMHHRIQEMAREIDQRSQQRSHPLRRKSDVVGSADAGARLAKPVLPSHQVTKLPENRWTVSGKATGSVAPDSSTLTPDNGARLSLLKSATVTAAMVLSLFAGVEKAHVLELRGAPQDLALDMGDAGTQATVFTMSVPEKGGVVVTEGGYTIYQDTTGLEKKITAAVDRIISENTSQNVFIKVQVSLVSTKEALTQYALQALAEAGRTQESEVRFGFVGNERELADMSRRLADLDQRMGGQLLGEKGPFNLSGRPAVSHRIVELLAPGTLDSSSEGVRYAFLDNSQGSRLSFDLPLARAVGQADLSDGNPMDTELVRASEIASGNRISDRGLLRDLYLGKILDAKIQKLYAWLPSTRAVNISQAFAALSSRLAALLQAA